MTAETTGFTWALYQGSWLPCRVLEEDPQTGTLEVRVTDRTGTREVWLRPEQVRGFTRGCGTAADDQQDCALDGSQVHRKVAH